MRLEMDVPGVRWCFYMVHCFWISGIANVDDAEAFREHVADIGEPAIYHQLHAVCAPTLVAMADKAHVSCVVRLNVQVSSHGVPL
jgi:hypothetical protein